MFIRQNNRGMVPNEQTTPLFTPSVAKIMPQVLLNVSIKAGGIFLVIPDFLFVVDF